MKKLLLILAILTVPQLAAAEGLICSQEVYCGADGVLDKQYQELEAKFLEVSDPCVLQKLHACALKREKSQDDICYDQVKELSYAAETAVKRNKKLRKKFRRLKNSCN